MTRTSPVPRLACSRVALGLLALALAAAPARAAVDVQASLDPEVGLEDTATLSITVSGSGFGGIDGVPQFALQNLKVLNGPSQSQNFSWVNGQTSSSITLSWQLAPLALGPGSVRDIKVKVGDQVYSPPEQRTNVVAEPPNGRQVARPRDPLQDLFDDPFGDRRAAPQRQPKVFLRAEAAPADPFVGQQTLYTLYLYTQTDVSAVNPVALPSFRGFWARDIPQPQRQLRPDMVDYQGERYARVAILQKALFPLAPGALAIEPARLEVVLRVAGLGPFGQLVAQPQEVEQTSNGVSLTARPLPPGPAGFPGTVGRLKLDAKLEPSRVRTGEAATLTLTLSGQGNLQGVPDPVLPPLDGVRAFAPQKSGGDDVQGTTVTGRRTWSYVLVPERVGTWTVPAVTVPFYDPAGPGYGAASSSPQTLEATPAANPATPAPPPVAAPTAAAPVGNGMPLVWMAALGGALGGALLVGVGLWTSRALRRRRRSGAAVAALTRALAAAAREERPRAVAESVEQAWRDFLSERWGLPAGLASERWVDELAPRGIPAEAIAGLRRLSEDLHYLRNAPQLSATETVQDELRDLSRRLARLLQ